MYSRGFRFINVIAVALGLAVALGSVANAQQPRPGGPTIRSQQGGTLEISPSIPTQRQQNPPQSSGNVREIPVIPPNQQVLTLPQASIDFIGRWGGAILLQSSTGGSNAPREALTSFVFGKRNGKVVLATTVFGSEQSQVLSTSAVSDGPRAVRLRIAGIDYNHRPPLRHVETIRLELASGNRLKCTKTVKLYVGGYPDPAAVAHYEGLLHPLTASENRYLTEQVNRNGLVPRARIEEGNPPPD